MPKRPKQFIIIFFTLAIILSLIFSIISQVAAVDINLADTSGWTPVFVSNDHDPLGDAQAGGTSGANDLVGDMNNPCAFIAFSGDGTEFAIRARVAGLDGYNPSHFKNFLFIGVDANMNGTVDFFLGLYNPTGNGRLGIYPADPSASNIGPSSTGITGKPLAAFQPVMQAQGQPTNPKANFSIIPAGTNLGGKGGDWFISFKFNVDDITKAVAEGVASGKIKENISFDASTVFRFFVGTATQDNSFNSDISGMGANSWKSKESWENLGVFSPPVSVNDGAEAAENGNVDVFSYNLVFDTNGGYKNAEPSIIAVKAVSGNITVELPETEPLHLSKYFDGWNTSPYGNGIIVINGSTLLTTLADENRNIRIYAKWTSDEPEIKYDDFTVTFVPNGGTWTSSWGGGTGNITRPTINGVLGADFPTEASMIPPRLTGNENYAFGGWRDANGVYYSPTTLITENLTLTAQWIDPRLNGNRTMFYFYDGTILIKISESSGPTLSGTPKLPEKPGYISYSWVYGTASGADTPYRYVQSDTVTGIINTINYLYAIWNPIPVPTHYIIKYHPNGGIWSDNSTAIKHEQVLIADAEFSDRTDISRDNWQLLGWNTQADGSGIMISELVDKSINKDIEVYAIWGWNTSPLTVIFDANKGYFETDKGVVDNLVIDVENGRLEYLPFSPMRNAEGIGFEKTEFTLLGWSENSTALTPTNINFSTEIFETNKTFYAVWDEIYSVTFHPNGGVWQDGGNTPMTTGTAYGSVMFIPQDPMPGVGREGWTFAGWYDVTGIIEVTYDTEITRSMTVYAKWEPPQGTIVHTVKFEGIVVDKDGNQTMPILLAVKVVIENEPVIVPNLIDLDIDGLGVKVSSIFDGWYLDTNFSTKWNFGNPVTGNMTLYAKFERKEGNPDDPVQGGHAHIHFTGQQYTEYANEHNGYRFHLSEEEHDTDVGNYYDDIGVWAKIINSTDMVYRIEIEWGPMKFEYKLGKENDPEGWYGSDNVNNKITVTNRSNADVIVKFEITENKFEDEEVDISLYVSEVNVTAEDIPLGWESNNSVEAYLRLKGIPSEEDIDTFSGDIWRKAGIITVTITPDN